MLLETFAALPVYPSQCHDDAFMFPQSTHQPVPCLSLITQRLMQDLRRAQGDASALERRLDNALEEERELRRAFEADKRLRKEKEEKQQASLREQSLLREEQESARTLERVESDVGDGSLGSMKARFVNENTRGGLGAMEEGGEGQGGDGGKAEVHSVDFAGEDDDEDVWQQVDIPSREQQEDVVEG